jgi:hypothetical protein
MAGEVRDFMYPLFTMKRVLIENGSKLDKGAQLEHLLGVQYSTWTRLSKSFQKFPLKKWNEAQICMIKF